MYYKIMAYTVYKHTSPNGKIYIGITGNDPMKRWNNGNGYRNNKHFYSAIKKYGWHNFSHEILAVNVSREVACRMEIDLISKFKSSDPLYGYNRSSGGEYGGSGVHWSEQLRKKQSERMKGENNPLYGKHLSESHRRKIRESHKGENAVWYGKKLSKEHRNKLSESHKGKYMGANSPVAHSVICIETSEIFGSIREAGRVKNTNSNSIVNVLIGKSKTAGGYHWRYFKEGGDLD